MFSGMQQDLSVSKHPVQFIYEGLNVRLTARDGSSLLSITNEKSTKSTVIQVEGVCIGHILLNNYLIVFSTTSGDRNDSGRTEGTDYITRIDLSMNLEEQLSEAKTVLYEGSAENNLSFCTLNPIDTVAYYENDTIQKVYWTDGYNQPRMINIVAEHDDYVSSSFDFIPELQLQEDVEVVKVTNASGSFPAGVLQYAFTYYIKNGQESNIFHTTPLLYVSPDGRGGEPGESVSNAFQIYISNVDTHFDYLRIYSILRTSLNAVPIVKKVIDLDIKKPSDDTGIEIITGQTPNYLLPSDDISYYDPQDRQIHSISEITLGKIWTDGTESYGEDATAGVIPITGSGYLVNINSDYTGFRNGTAVFLKGYGYKLYVGNYIYQHPERISPDTGRPVVDDRCAFLVTHDADNSKWYLTCLNVHKTPTIGEKLDNNGNYYDFRVLRTSTRELNKTLTFTDNNNLGESVDPEHLLYLGREVISAATIEQKDGTLFLGNILLKRDSIPSDIKQRLYVENGAEFNQPLIQRNVICKKENRYYPLVGTESRLQAIDTLACRNNENYQGCSTFKRGEYYRLAVQFQHSSGVWSEPCWIGDKQICENRDAQSSIGNCPNYVINSGVGVLALPSMVFTLSYEILDALYAKGYRKVRGLYAVPSDNDRTVMYQGLVSAALRRDTDISNGIAAQSSWIFRIYNEHGVSTYTGSRRDGAYKGYPLCSPNIDLSVASVYDTRWYSDRLKAEKLDRSTEIMGVYEKKDCYWLSSRYSTLHTPDVAFGDTSFTPNNNLYIAPVGKVRFDRSFSDISIQTSSGPRENDSFNGPKEPFNLYDTWSSGVLVSGLLYADCVTDDISDGFQPYHIGEGNKPSLWMVYMWHKEGSLTNDVGNTAVLSTKKISNHRIAVTYENNGGESSVYYRTDPEIQLFNGTDALRFKQGYYYGNVNTALIPEDSPYFFVGSPSQTVDYPSQSSRLTFALGKFYDYNVAPAVEKEGLFAIGNGENDGVTTFVNDGVGDYKPGLRLWRNKVLIKYKSTPHFVICLKSYSDNPKDDYSMEGSLLLTDSDCAMLAEIRRPYDADQIYSGHSQSALMSNTFIPCGPSVKISEHNSDEQVYFKWGDTFFNRYECLKTYAFSDADPNQVVDVVSFMCESRVNTAGRYDKNGCRKSHLNTSPRNFNLYNPVYGQLDNFFSYRILEDSFYKIVSFPNQIAYTLEKQSGADTDNWTNVTLASTYDVDGSKGGIVSLNSWKDILYCFQEKGISQVLFNNRVQIPVSDGTPVEISNNYKMDGVRYLSDGIGSDDRNLIKEVTSGVYFIDSITGHLFHLSDNIKDISEGCKMSAWFRRNKDTFKNLCYDNINHDLYVVQKGSQGKALGFSEELNQFVSFYDYGGIDLMESYDSHVFALYSENIEAEGRIYKLFEGEGYNNIFGTNQPWSLTFISNGSSNNSSTLDKIFTNLEFRASVEGDWELDNKGKFTFILPFDSLETWNEYQHGTANLGIRNNHSDYQHHQEDGTASLKRKFRIWRCDIPRNNAPLASDSGLPNLFRKVRKPLDRMRNPWLYVKLQKNAAMENSYLNRTEVHDLVLTYFS